jgi:hypothetical protein
LISFAIAAATVAAQLQPGQLVTFQSIGKQPVCARITLIDTGLGGVPHAWLVETANPGRTDHLPVVDLVPGCAAEPRRAKTTWAPFPGPGKGLV